LQAQQALRPTSSKIQILTTMAVSDEWHDEASERTSLVKGKGRSKQQGENVL
jgi:hypothetical protein